MSSTDPHARPVELNLDRSRLLHIRWADGHESRISLVELRRACPCATCRALRAERAHNPLMVISAQASVEDQVTADGADLVGNYALRIRWKDGHEAGIYEFAMLRALGSSPSEP